MEIKIEEEKLKRALEYKQIEDDQSQRARCYQHLMHHKDFKQLVDCISNEYVKKGNQVNKSNKNKNLTYNIQKKVMLTRQN